MRVIYGKRMHRGGLDQSLSTKVEITEKEFTILVSNYDYYGFDPRVNQILFINLEREYQWLYVEVL